VTDVQNVLDQLTAGIVDRKSEKPASLTPVGTEKGGPLDGRHATMLPYDDAQTVQHAIRTGLRLMQNLQFELDHIGAGLIALGKLYGLTEAQATGTEPKPPVPADVQRERERAADAEDALREAERVESLGQRIERLSVEAQAATFAGSTLAGSWECPTHGGVYLTILTSRKGRLYNACIQCTEFEKGN
jgi:hypothetical protein